MDHEDWAVMLKLDSPAGFSAGSGKGIGNLRKPGNLTLVGHFWVMFK
jgi:hypothetical protein